MLKFCAVSRFFLYNIMRRQNSGQWGAAPPLSADVYYVGFSDVESEQHDVAVLHYVLLALEPDKSFFLRRWH